jgi:hypothetical protein
VGAHYHERSRCLTIYFIIMTHYAWTYFVGSLTDARKIVNEWNEITNTKCFQIVNSVKGTHLLEGCIDKNTLKETNIENEFVIAEL